jgi:ACT domain-containing protein
MNKQKVNFSLSSDNLNKLNFLIKDIQQLKGINIEYNNTNLDNHRGIDISSILSIVSTAIAIPALLKTIELFLETKKIDLEIAFPNKNIKIKISSFSKESLKEKIEQLDKIFREELQS